MAPLPIYLIKLMTLSETQLPCLELGDTNLCPWTGLLRGLNSEVLCEQ